MGIGKTILFKIWAGLKINVLRIFIYVKYSLLHSANKIRKNEDQYYGVEECIRIILCIHRLLDSYVFPEVPKERDYGQNEEKQNKEVDV